MITKNSVVKVQHINLNHKSQPVTSNPDNAFVLKPAHFIIPSKILTCIQAWFSYWFLLLNELN